MQITISDYILQRLKELSIKHIFGVPGDYNLSFLDQIIAMPGMSWIGTCNELNGSYAADGYARIHGVGALVTTFGVGELSAINGIAGAYTELIPVVHIVGMPSTTIIKKKSVVHHSLGDGQFKVFMDMYRNVTVAQVLISKNDAAAKIDKALVECWQKKRPIYIGLPSDLVLEKIPAPKRPLNLNYPKSNKDAVKECVARIAKIISKAKAPVILADLCADRHPMKVHLESLLEKTNIPFANMNMAKALIDESNPYYIGNYCGEFSDPGVKDKIEGSDCVITFGSMLSDLNTGGFSAQLNLNTSVEIHSSYTRIKQSLYKDVFFNEVVPALIKQLNNYKYTGTIKKEKRQIDKVKNNKLTQNYFWNKVVDGLCPNAIVLAEAGTSLFGALQIPMPNRTKFISQALWGSIGYTLGALLGAKIAAPKRQSVLFIGDGSFQLTAQEISTILRHHLNPIIFLLNNNGYTIERLIHGPDMPYNDIATWNYTEFPKMFKGKVHTLRIKTRKELDNITKQMKSGQLNKNQFVLIEVMLEKFDAPATLVNIARALDKENLGKTKKSKRKEK